jgi:uncharacterized protein YnzC (UPF0291/DUF896 family)
MPGWALSSCLEERKQMPDEPSQPDKHMVKFSVYLYRECARAKQEGVILMTTPRNENKELHFDYLDSIPAKIREHLKSVGLTYDVADDSDNSVIAQKSRKSKVIRKIRLRDSDAATHI